MTTQDRKVMRFFKWLMISIILTSIVLISYMPWEYTVPGGIVLVLSALVLRFRHILINIMKKTPTLDDP